LAKPRTCHSPLLTTAFEGSMGGAKTIYSFTDQIIIYHFKKWKCWALKILQAISKIVSGQIWWYIPVIPALTKLRRIKHMETVWAT
jgi:hypothetical protein